MSSTTPTSQFGILPKYSAVNVKQLADVDIDTVANNNIMKWDATLGRWINSNTASLSSLTAATISATTSVTTPLLYLADGAAGVVGNATLGAGGTITVSTTAVTNDSYIFLTRKTAGGTTGDLTPSTIVAGVSFDIDSTNTDDTSVVNWLIINPSA